MPAGTALAHGAPPARRCRRWMHRPCGHARALLRLITLLVPLGTRGALGTWGSLGTLGGFGTLGTLGLGGCAHQAPVAAPPSSASPGAAHPGEALQQVAPGVYLLPGLPGEVGPDNAGRVGNAGFIVGAQGVLAIDSGSSAAQGAALLAAIRQTTALPVRGLLLTQARQEFIFGASAFQQQGIPVLMHPLAARQMAARCEGCLKTLRRELGEAAMAGTRVVKPDRLVDSSAQLPAIGRPLRLLHWGHSSGPGHVSLLDERSRVLFAGGLLDARRIPDVQDADLAHWLDALQALAQLPLSTLVPGHGPASPPGLPAQVTDYLGQLQAGARRLLQRDAALSTVAEGLHLPDFADWDQYDTIHRRNAALVFLRLEQAQLAR